MPCKYTCCAFSFLLLVLVSSAASKNVDNSDRTFEESNCSKVKQFLETRNISAVPARGADDKGEIHTDQKTHIHKTHFVIL